MTSDYIGGRPQLELCYRLTPMLSNFSCLLHFHHSCNLRTVFATV